MGGRFSENMKGIPMTRARAFRFRTPLVIGSAVAALAVPLAAASAASAAPLHSESFSISISTADPAGTVVAHGAVSGHGTITDPSPTLAVLHLTGGRHGAGTVNVWHTAEPAPVVNHRTCIATVNERGRWAFAGGTGADLGAAGSGRFTLREVDILKRGRHGACETAKPPVFSQVTVTATGRAAR